MTDRGYDVEDWPGYGPPMMPGSAELKTEVTAFRARLRAWAGPERHPLSAVASAGAERQAASC